MEIWWKKLSNSFAWIFILAYLIAQNSSHSRPRLLLGSANSSMHEIQSFVSSLRTGRKLNRGIMNISLVVKLNMMLTRLFCFVFFLQFSVLLLRLRYHLIDTETLSNIPIRDTGENVKQRSMSFRNF